MLDSCAEEDWERTLSTYRNCVEDEVQLLLDHDSTADLPLCTLHQWLSTQLVNKVAIASHKGKGTNIVFTYNMRNRFHGGQNKRPTMFSSLALLHRLQTQFL